MWASVLKFILSEEGITTVVAGVGAIYGYIFKKKLDQRWTFILRSAPRVYLYIEQKLSRATPEAKRGGFRARMDELLIANGFKPVTDKDWLKLAQWLIDEAQIHKATGPSRVPLPLPVP